MLKRDVTALSNIRPVAPESEISAPTRRRAVSQYPLLVGVIAAAATHVVMKQKSVQMLERAKAPWQSYGSRDEEGAPLIAKRPSLSFSV